MQTEQIRVSGMTCGGCTNSVTRALKAIPGVGAVNVSLVAGEATVEYDERRASLEQLKSAVKSAGYGVDVDKGVQSRPGKGGCCG